jgi:hypothetical protein
VAWSDILSYVGFKKKEEPHYWELFIFPIPYAFAMTVPPGELVMLQELALDPVAFQNKSIRATGM